MSESLYEFVLAGMASVDMVESAVDLIRIHEGFREWLLTKVPTSHKVTLMERPSWSDDAIEVPPSKFYESSIMICAHDQSFIVRPAWKLHLPWHGGEPVSLYATKDGRWWLTAPFEVDRGPHGDSISFYDPVLGSHHEISIQTFACDGRSVMRMFSRADLAYCRKQLPSQCVKDLVRVLKDEDPFVNAPDIEDKIIAREMYDDLCYMIRLGKCPPVLQEALKTWFRDTHPSIREYIETSLVPPEASNHGS